MESDADRLFSRRLTRALRYEAAQLEAPAGLHHVQTRDGTTAGLGYRDSALDHLRNANWGRRGVRARPAAPGANAGWQTHLAFALQLNGERDALLRQRQRIGLLLLRSRRDHRRRAERFCLVVDKARLFGHHARHLRARAPRASRAGPPPPGGRGKGGGGGRVMGGRIILPGKRTSIECEKQRP